MKNQSSNLKDLGLMDLNIQLFAEGDSNNTDANSTDNSTISFDEILKDPNYQKEFDKKVAKALETSKEKWEKAAEVKKTEAEKLAKMNAEEKKNYEIKKLEDERNEAIAKLNSYELKEEAVKIANEKELDLSLIEILDYSKETAESIKTKIDNISTIFNKAVEKKLTEKLQQNGPRFVRSTTIDENKEYLKEKYKNNPYYKG